METATHKGREGDPHQTVFMYQQDVQSYSRFGECPFFPPDFPKPFEQITVTEATLLVLAKNTLHIYDMTDLNIGGRTSAFTLESFPSGIKLVICNARYASDWSTDTSSGQTGWAPRRG